MAALPFEAQLSQALTDNVFPGAVLRAKSKDGRINYTKSIGSWDTTTIFQLMSMTKLFTSVAAAKAIELGLISLDADIAPVLPTLAAQPILTGFDSDGKPILRKREKTLTLRHLLTHSYGQTYSFFEAGATAQFLETKGITPSFPSGAHSVEETFDYPLLSEPGDSWSYSPGIDWAGRAVEKVSGATLEEFMRVHIFEPLGISSDDYTFFPAARPGVLARTAEVWTRDEGTGKSVPAPPDAIDLDPAQVRHCMGGSGLSGTADGYFKLMESLLLDDERVLKKETAELLFEPQLRLKGEVGEVPVPDGAVGWIPESAGGYKWSLAGLLTPAGNGHRGKKFLQWGGMLNSSWFIDREAGLAGLFATSLLPPGDAQNEELLKIYELGLYDQLNA